MLLHKLIGSLSKGRDYYVFDASTAEQSFVVPAGVTSISILCVGSGGDGDTANQLDPTPAGCGGGGGGALAYTNNIAVTPDESLIVRCPVEGTAYVKRGTTTLVSADSGDPGQNSSGGSGGSATLSVGSFKASGGAGRSGSTTSALGGGGGGAATTSRSGGTGALATTEGRGGGYGEAIRVVATNPTGYSILSASSESTTTGGRNAEFRGAGGGGAVNTGTSYGIGGAGGDGLVVILWGGRTFSSGTSF